MTATNKILAALKVFYRGLRRFNRKNAWVLSSHIAMSMMMALFPFVLFTVALSGAIASLMSHSIVVEDVVDLVFGSWPPSVAAPITREVYAVLQSSGTGLMTLGGVLALYFASNGVDAIRIAMLHAYGQEETRPFWKHRLISLALVILGGAGLLLAAVFELFLPLGARFLARFFPDLKLLSGWENGASGLSVLVIPIAAVFLYHIVLLPRRAPLARIIPGVVVTLLLWWGAGAGFAYYVSSFASYSATYAGLAGAMAALIFLYLNAAILILGAEINGVLQSDLLAAAAKDQP
ncbi:YihY/virulence factor BrkB family protein [Phaeobacter sp. HF9A]|uniref:YihY/virulence factor BrkB family protein n=1 Tax=Phaeobacter sp. HF9A TaxID=2721561 RepID=UPI0014313242|nr:YihY/virulence factor BrkB family protein [Phaeobacter sp. HF9A]NIZ14932.1 YihY/virulence factor BrkB family protein [Phaeobacter sp. HF9A]